jgi:hypothetical protein
MYVVNAVGRMCIGNEGRGDSIHNIEKVISVLSRQTFC